MKNTSKYLLLIWDILLFPTIILVLLQILSSTLIENLFVMPVIGHLMDFVCYISAALSTFLIPQIISAVLVIVNTVSLIKDRYICPVKKELPSFLLLCIWCILGAACAFYMLKAVSIGEAGQPLP